MKNKGDIKILSVIAEYKFLTAKQISILCQRSIQTVNRRLKALSDNHLISKQQRIFGPGPGRKEFVNIISDKGMEILQDNKTLSKHASYITDNTSNLIFIEHDLLLNWFLIALLQIGWLNQNFEISPLTTSSHYLTVSNLIMEQFSSKDKPDEIQTMIPDGVFTITEKSMNKTLLFFLEVDMGTETLASPKQSPKDIRQKIINYQSLFKQKKYKRYKKIFNCNLNGFRLLFLTNTSSRKKSICNLVRNMPPSDFIWVTDQNSMFVNGVAANIWARGGNDNKKLESILTERFAFKISNFKEVRSF
jgi:hypothetical protein